MRRARFILGLIIAAALPGAVVLAMSIETESSAGPMAHTALAGEADPGGNSDSARGLESGAGGSLSTGGFLGFTQTPRNPGNALERMGVAGRSLAGRPIMVRQLGDPAIPGRLLVFDCIHGDECAATGKIQPLANGCPNPAANIYIVANLNPDGHARGTRVNLRGVDLNRNFPSGWAPIGALGDPEYAGPRPFSEPEARLAAHVVHRLRPKVTVWFHQDRAARPFVRAWGQSVPAARRLARLAGIPFRLMRWLPGTAPNWQNHRFPGTASFVVEVPRDARTVSWSRLSEAVDHLAREVGKD